MNIQKLTKQFSDARDSLSGNTLSKRGYLSVSNNILCMCAHTAFHFQTNPRLRRAVNVIDEDLSPQLKLSRMLAGIIPMNDAIMFGLYNPTQEAWNNLPDWITTNTGRGSLEGHFLLGAVGLTFEFNDHPDTTIEMIRYKYDLALQLLQQFTRKPFERNFDKVA